MHKGRKVGIIAHQKSSHLQSALLNNVLGIQPGTSGKDILDSGMQAIEKIYPEVEQIKKEKVWKSHFWKMVSVLTNKDDIRLQSGHFSCRLYQSLQN